MEIIIVTGKNKKERRRAYIAAIAKEFYNKDYIVKLKGGVPIEPNKVYVAKYKTHMSYDDIKRLANINVDSCVVIETRKCDSITVMAKILDTSRNIHHGRNNHLELDYLNSIVSTMSETPCVGYLLSTESEEETSVLYRYDDTTHAYKRLSTSYSVYAKDIWFDALTQAGHMNPKPYQPLEPCPHGDCRTCEHNRYVAEYGQKACHLEEDEEENTGDE